MGCIEASPLVAFQLFSNGRARGDILGPFSFRRLVKFVFVVPAHQGFREINAAQIPARVIGKLNIRLGAFPQWAAFDFALVIALHCCQLVAKFCTAPFNNLAPNRFGNGNANAVWAFSLEAIGDWLLDRGAGIDDGANDRTVIGNDFDLEPFVAFLDVLDHRKAMFGQRKGVKAKAQGLGANGKASAWIIAQMNWHGQLREGHQLAEFHDFHHGLKANAAKVHVNHGVSSGNLVQLLFNFIRVHYATSLLSSCSS